MKCTIMIHVQNLFIKCLQKEIENEKQERNI